jgi:hypothetical protein
MKLERYIKVWRCVYVLTPFALNTLPIYCNSGCLPSLLGADAGEVGTFFLVLESAMIRYPMLCVLFSAASVHRRVVWFFCTVLPRNDLLGMDVFNFI